MVHHFSATADAGGVAIQAEQSGNWPLPYAEIAIALPASERRPLTLRSDRIPLRPPAGVASIDAALGVPAPFLASGHLKP